MSKREFRQIKSNFVKIVAMMHEDAVRGEHDLMAAELMAGQTKMFCVVEPGIRDVEAVAIVTVKGKRMYVDAVQRFYPPSNKHTEKIMWILFEGLASYADSLGIKKWECRTNKPDVLKNYLYFYDPVVIDTVLECDVRRRGVE